MTRDECGRMNGDRIERFKPYLAYGDSGVEWPGKIPEHWELAPIYSRYEAALGKMLDAKRATGQFSRPYLRNVDVQWDTVNIDGLPEMDFAPSERDAFPPHRGYRIPELVEARQGLRQRGRRPEHPERVNDRSASWRCCQFGLVRVAMCHYSFGVTMSTPKGGFSLASFNSKCR